MEKFVAVVGIAFLFGIALGCDADQPSEPATDEAAEPVDDQPAEEPDEPDTEEPDEPRINETDVPDDDEIGQLPEGIGIPTGESIPDVDAEDEDGEQVSLTTLAADNEAIVLFFYRGGWCPFCNFQVREMTEAADQFADRGALPVAISVDRPEKASETAATYDIPFPVLSDPDLEVHEAFDVVYEAEQEEVDRLAEMGMDLGEASGRDHNSYAIPGVFIIDADGEVLWAHANKDYSVRPSPQQLLEVIDGVNAE